MEKIVDTNVPLTAGEEACPLGVECREACIHTIRDIWEGRHRLVLDGSGIIFRQYQENFGKRGDLGIAGRFQAWLLRNLFIPEHVKLVDIQPIDDYGDFEELPDEVRQSDFDRSDRVFVALALANGNAAPIVQAADSKWIGWEAMLSRHGITLEFPCRQALEQVHERRKRRRK